MNTSPILPVAMRLSARPGQATHGDFIIKRSMPDGALVAMLVGDTRLFRLRDFIAMEMISETLTDEEFEQLPLALRTPEHRHSVRVEQTASAGMGEPLAVRFGHIVTGFIDCVADADALPAAHHATLRIEGFASGPLEMPIAFVTAGVQVEFPVRPVIAHPFQWVTMPVRVSLPGAPDTDLVLVDTEALVEIPRTPVHVPQGGSATVTLNLRVAPDMALGPHSSVLTVEGHSPGFDRIPFDLLVKPPVLPPQIDRGAVVDAIHRRYLENGGSGGMLGYPTSDVRLAGNMATRTYRGGEIRALAQFDAEGRLGVLTRAIPTQETRITLLGFRCVRESASDGLSDTDEPYFVTAVDNGRGIARTRKFGPFPNTRTGSETGIGAILISDEPPNPTSLLVSVYENDHGDPDRTAKNIQDKAVEVARQLQSLLAASGADAADGPGVGPAAVAGGAAGIIAGPLGSLAAAAIVSALGLGDDFVGQDAALFFLRPEEVGTKPPLGRFRDQDFNTRVVIDGGDEGHYELFLDVHVQERPAPVTVPFGP